MVVFSHSEEYGKSGVVMLGVFKKSLDRSPGGQLRHVDGLRTIAIIPVILFHINSVLCPGGFVGVDIFFVISGFLITSRIIDDMDARKFSFLDFYARRAKRIIPVYSLVLLVVICTLPLLYSTLEAKSVIESAQFSLFFSANVYYSNFISYFDVAAQSNPLLHLWSLGVEEQFYLVVPLLIFLIFRWKRKALNPILGGLFIASFILSEVCLFSGARDFAFYQLPTRAWELLAGAILGQLPATKASVKTKTGLSYLGLLVIGLTLVFLDEKQLFPGALALLPVTGAALLIRYGDVGPVGRFLSSFSMVLIGRMSYSLYIWHWPILLAVRQFPPVAMVLGTILIFLIAFLSWNYFENPIRRSKKLTTVRALSMVPVTIVLLFSLGWGLQSVTGRNGDLFSEWHGTDLWPVLEKRRDPARSACSLEDLKAEKGSVLIKLGSPAVRPDFVLWGDSEALALMPGVDAEALKYGQAGYFLNVKQSLTTVSQIGTYPFEPVKDREPILRWLENDPEIRSVFLVNAWVTGKLINQDDIDTMDQLCQRLKRAGKAVVVFTCPPLPHLRMVRLADWGANVSDNLQDVSIDSYRRISPMQDSLLTRLRASGSAQIIESDQAFLANGNYIMSDHSRPLFIDATHVNRMGAMKIMAYAAPAIWPTGVKIGS